LVNNFAIYGLKQEAKLAGNTIINTYTIVNDILWDEYRRSREVAAEAKMLVSITYNNVKSVAAAQYQRAKEVGIEANYIGRVAYNYAASGVINSSNFVYSRINYVFDQVGSFLPGLQTKYFDAGMVSLINPEAERVMDNGKNLLRANLSNEPPLNYFNNSFAGPTLIYGPILRKPINIYSITPEAPVINNGQTIQTQVNQNNFVSNDLPIEEIVKYPGSIEKEDNHLPPVIEDVSEESSSIVAENNNESIEYYPPQIFTAADLVSYSFSPILTPIIALSPTPTPTPTLIPTPIPIAMPSPTPILSLTPIITPELTQAPEEKSDPDTTSLSRKITDLDASMGHKRGQVALSWSAVTDAFFYDIIYSDIPFNESYASEYFVLNITADNIASQNLSLDNLAPGKEFFFNVRSYDQGGNIFDNSNTASAFSNGYADNIVISEIQIAGDSAKEEFVELYNPTENDIDLAELPLKLHIVNSKEVTQAKIWIL